MAKFCENCGSPLEPGAKFCVNCGTKIEAAPAPEPAPEPEPTDEVKPETPVEPTPAPEPKADTTPVPEDRSADDVPAYKKPGYFKKEEPKQPAGQPTNSKKILIIAVAALLIVALIVACILIFSGKKDDDDDDDSGRSKSKTVDIENLETLREYAESLEKAGMTEAAAAVYELIAKGGGAEYIQKAHEDIPIIEAADEAEQIKDVFGGAKGGDEE